MNWKTIEKNIKKRTEKERQEILNRPLAKKWIKWHQKLSAEYDRRFDK